MTGSDPSLDVSVASSGDGIQLQRHQHQHDDDDDDDDDDDGSADDDRERHRPGDDAAADDDAGAGVGIPLRDAVRPGSVRFHRKRKASGDERACASSVASPKTARCVELCVSVQTNA